MSPQMSTFLSPDNIKFVGSGIILLIVYLVFKVWAFSRDIHKEIIQIVKEFIETEDHKNYVLKIIKTDISNCISKAFKEHNEAAEAHSGYRRMIDAFIRTHVQQELMAHNENKVAHHVALEDYPDRRELNGAILRLEDKITAQGDKIIARIEVLNVKFDKANGSQS